MDLLVTVPAAIEEALASLMLDPSDPALQTRAALTYVRRLYHPYLIRQPLIASSQVGSQSGDPTITITWLYEDPQTAGSSTEEGLGRRTCVGALLLIGKLSDLPPFLSLLGSEILSMGMGQLPLSLHVVVTGGEPTLSDSTTSVDPTRVKLDGTMSLLSLSELMGASRTDPVASFSGAELVGHIKMLYFYDDNCHLHYINWSSNVPIR